jgi:hypothetical protein
MKRSLTVILTGGVAAAAIAGFLALRPATSAADPAKTKGPPAVHLAAPSETSVQLPIGQVVLFSSGVGYFQREGQIDGDARVDLYSTRQ